MEEFQKKNLDHFSPSFLGQKYYSLSHIQSTVQTKVEFVIHILGVNPNWHEPRKQEKCSSLAPPRSNFYNT